MNKLLAAFAAACVLTAVPSYAQTGGMKIVISFPPGGPVDFVARVLAEGLAKELNQTVIVDNRPGANGGIAAQAVAKAPPTGTRCGSRAQAPRS